MKKKISLTLLILVVILAAAVGVAGWKYHSYAKLETIYPGVYIGGMDVGGMDVEQAEATVEDYVKEVSAKKIVLHVEDGTESFPLSRTGLFCDGAEAVKQAYQAGRSGNMFQRMKEIHEISKGKEIPLHFQTEKKKLLNIVRKKGKSFVTEKKDAGITRKDDEFIITEGENGISIDFEENAKKLAEEIENFDWSRGELSFDMDYQVDAPKHTAKELSRIQDKLGSFTTSYAGSSQGRCQNVENGARLINGTVLYPGETLSVHDVVAPFTYENGYRLAGSYENGKTVQSYGGGICQVSTTLYNAVLRAELEVIERQNHSMTVHYVALSEDAAIAGTEKDFKFKNNLDAPIYIEGKAGDSSISFSIYGEEYREEGRSVEYVSERVSTRPPSEKVVKDKTLEEGKKVVDQAGVTGYTARLWKVVYEDGKETDRIQVNSSSYMSVPRVVRIGTKKKETPKKDTDTKKKDKKKKKTSEKNSEKKNKKKSKDA